MATRGKSSSGGRSSSGAGRSSGASKATASRGKSAGGRGKSQGAGRPAKSGKSSGRGGSSGDRSSRAGGSARATTDHDEIRRWVEERGGTPATVKGTERKGEEAGLLRIDFPGYSGAGSLEAISWEDFFDKFEESGLEFLYQDSTREGAESRFFKLVARESGSSAKSSGGKSGGTKSRATRSRGNAASRKSGSSASRRARSARE